MKTIQKFCVALLVVSIAISCKQEYSPAEEAVTEEVNAADGKVVSSNAAVEPKKTNRKFVRTADIKFKVKNVSQTTYAIENATTKFGGFVTNTDLQTSVSEKEEIKISQDSSVVNSKYTVENNITIRVPNTQLDTVIKTINKQIDFLDYRVIKADDVSLKLLANEMSQTRNTNHENRLANAIETKGKKLNDIAIAEDNLENKIEQKDNTKLENMALNDLVNFSTISLQLYQRETIKQEKIANIVVFRQNIGSKIIDNLANGWYILENIILFIIQFWSILLLAFMAWIGYKKMSKFKILKD